MKIIIIFWINAENYMGCAAYPTDEEEARSVEEIVRAFERSRGLDEGSCFGQVDELAEV